MAKVNNSLWNISGALGDKVFCNGPTGPYVRQRTTPKNNTPSPAQERVRSKLVIASYFLNPFRQIINLCWRDRNAKMAPFDAAMSHLIKEGIDVSGGEPRIIFEEVWLSRGTLPKPYNVSFELDNGMALIGWQSLQSLYSQPSDEAIVVFYNEDMEAGLVGREPADRGDCMFLETLPEGFLKGKIHAYLFFLSRDEKSASGTTYLGFVSNNL